MIRRYREVLSMILNTDGYITGSELAEACDVSLRTIQLDIKKINNLLKKHDLKIDSSVKKGYFFSEQSKKNMIEKNIIRSVMDHEYVVEIPTTPLDRQMYILLNLTVEESIDVDKLADSLYVSTSTIQKDIDNTKKWLKEHLNLNISYSLAKGIKLKCSEEEKRNIISWIFGSKINISTNTKYWNYLFKETKIIEYLNKIHSIIFETKEFGYTLSGYSENLFCIEILTVIKRVQLGLKLDEASATTDELLPVIAELRDKVQKDFNVAMPMVEWLNLQHHFVSKQFTKGTDIKLFETKEAIHIIDEFFRRVYEKFGVNLAVCEIVRDNLFLYITPMINRLKFKHCIANPINENIIESYSMEFEMAQVMSSIIKEYLNLNLSSIELAYLTMNLLSTNGMWGKKLNTVIVSDYDESIISFIKNKMIKLFDDKLKFYGFYTYFQFTEEKKERFQNIDFIITTSTLADKTNIPFIRVSATMCSEDILNMFKHLQGLKAMNEG